MRSVFTASNGPDRVAASVDGSHAGSASRHVVKPAIAAPTAALAAASAAAAGETVVGGSVVAGDVVVGAGVSTVVVSGCADEVVMRGPDVGVVAGGAVVVGSAFSPELHAATSSTHERRAPTR